MVPHLEAVQQVVPHLEAVHFHHLEQVVLHLEEVQYNQEEVQYNQEAVHFRYLQEEAPVLLVLDHLAVEHHPLLEAGYNHPLQEEVEHRLLLEADIQEHKDCLHNLLDLVLDHLAVEHHPLMEAGYNLSLIHI